MTLIMTKQTAGLLTEGEVTSYNHCCYLSTHTHVHAHMCGTLNGFRHHRWRDPC